MIYEVVRIVPTYHTIPIPFGMGISESWEAIQRAQLTKTPAWEPGTLIKGYVTIVASPAGRIVAIHI